METLNTFNVEDGRACSADVILSQIGKHTLWAVLSGDAQALSNAYEKEEAQYEGERYEYGVTLPLSYDRNLVVILDFSDTYSVYRTRQIMKGENKGKVIIEAWTDDIYCENLSDVVYDMSCWK